MSPAFGTFVASRVAALREAEVVVDVVALTDARTHARVVRKYGWFVLRCLIAAVRAQLTGSRYDVVEAHIAYPTGLIALPVARFVRGRLVLFAHGSDVMIIPGRSRLHAQLAAFVYARADLVVANSEFIRQELLRRFHPRRTVVISPGVAPAHFAATNEGPRGDVILYVGRLVDAKGVDILLEAFAELSLPPPWRLEIVGDGPMKTQLEAQARRLGVDVCFLGALPPAMVRERMAHAAVVAVPSTWHEPLGLVPLEAMAAGALVVASGVGGMLETVLDGETGFTVPAGDAKGVAGGLARAVEMLSRDDELTAMRDAASKMASRHCADSVVRESIAVFRDMLGSKYPQPTAGGM